MVIYVKISSVCSHFIVISDRILIVIYLEIRAIAKDMAAEFEKSTLLEDADKVSVLVKAIIV